jgi:hypothetical protein
MANKSKSKGNYGERRWASLLSDFTGEKFRKTPSSGGFNKQGGVVIAEHKFCGDVICDNQDFIFCLESKNRPDDFQLALLNTRPESAEFTKWWFQTCLDAKTNQLLPFLGFKVGASAGTVGNDFVAMSYAVLQHIGYPQDMPLTVLEVYRKPFWLKMTKSTGSKKKGTKTTYQKYFVSFPIPCIVNWKLISENCDKDSFFNMPDWSISECEKFIIHESDP